MRQLVAASMCPCPACSRTTQFVWQCRQCGSAEGGFVRRSVSQGGSPAQASYRPLGAPWPKPKRAAVLDSPAAGCACPARRGIRSCLKPHLLGFGLRRGFKERALVVCLLDPLTSDVEILWFALDAVEGFTHVGAGDAGCS